jgi:hypothetical protein
MPSNVCVFEISFLPLSFLTFLVSLGTGLIFLSAMALFLISDCPLGYAFRPARPMPISRSIHGFISSAFSVNLNRTGSAMPSGKASGVKNKELIFDFSYFFNSDASP